MDASLPSRNGPALARLIAAPMVRAHYNDQEFRAAAARVIAFYDEALALSDACGEAYVHRAWARRALDDDAGARADAESALARGPMGFREYVMVKLCFEPAERAAVLERAIAQVPHDPLLRCELRWALAVNEGRRGHFAGQVAALRALIAEPDLRGGDLSDIVAESWPQGGWHVLYRRVLGAALETLGDLDEAERVYREALALDPRGPDRLIRLALRRGRFDNARALLDAARGSPDEAGVAGLRIVLDALADGRSPRRADLEALAETTSAEDFLPLGLGLILSGRDPDGRRYLALLVAEFERLPQDEAAYLAWEVSVARTWLARPPAGWLTQLRRRLAA